MPWIIEGNWCNRVYKCEILIHSSGMSAVPWFSMQTWVIWLGLRYWQVGSSITCCQVALCAKRQWCAGASQFPQLRPRRCKKGSDTRWSFRWHYFRAGGLTDLNARWPSQGETCRGKRMKLSGCSREWSAFPQSAAIFHGFILEVTW